MLELLLGQIPEAVYFAVFMILVKGFNKNRVLFTVCVVFQYLLLCSIFPYDVKFQVLFVFTTYLIMKLFYKDKVQITDLFLFLYAMFILIIASVVLFSLHIFLKIDYILLNIVCKLIVFSYIILRKKSIQKWYVKYYLNWNRKEGLKIRSLDIRNGSLIFMYSVIAILDLGLLFAILVGR